MAPPVLTAMPTEFRAGETVEYELTLPDYPPGTHSLTVHLRGIGSADASVGEGASKYTVTFSAALTGALAPGVYQFSELITVTAGGKVVEVGAGVVSVLRNLATAPAGSAQTHAEKMVAILETAIQDLTSGKIQAYSIGGRTVTYNDLPELQKMLAKYQSEVRMQRSPGQPFQDIHVTFLRPGSV